MIGKLTGILDTRGEDWVILDVNGVGYEVACAPAMLARLPAAGEQAVLWIETVVRENEISLFGFASQSEREWFRLLVTVQGIGAKLAVAILGTLPPADLATAIALQDIAQLCRAPGVGKKVGQRIATELRDKAPALTPAGVGLAALTAGGAGDGALAAPALEAISALTNLGYQPAQASAAIAAAAKAAGEGAATEALIRLGLKELAR